MLSKRCIIGMNEKYALAAKINMALMQQDNQAIDLNKIQSIPRRLLRRLWLEIKLEYGN